MNKSKNTRLNQILQRLNEIKNELIQINEKREIDKISIELKNSGNLPNTTI